MIAIPPIHKSPESPRPKTKMFGFTIADIAGSTPDPRKYHKPFPDQRVLCIGPNSDYFAGNLMT